MPRVNIIFHSVSGHTFKLAEELGTGVASIDACEFKLLRIPEPGGAVSDSLACAIGIALNFDRQSDVGFADVSRSIICLSAGGCT